MTPTAPVEAPVLIGRGPTTVFPLSEPVSHPPAANVARLLETPGRSLGDSARSEPIVERLVSGPERLQRALERSKRGLPDRCRAPPGCAEVACGRTAVPSSRSKESGCIEEVDFTLPDARSGLEWAGTHSAGPSITRPGFGTNRLETSSGHPEFPPDYPTLETSSCAVDTDCRAISGGTVAGR